MSLNPSWGGFDEAQHIARVENISQGYILPTLVERKDIDTTLFTDNGSTDSLYGGIIDYDLINLSIQNIHKFQGGSDPYSLFEILSQGRGEISHHKVTFPFSNTAVNSPFAYLPQLLGYRIGLIFGTVRSVILCMRISQVIVLACTFYFLTYYSPIGKATTAYLFLLPVNVITNACVTADTISFACSIVYISTLGWIVLCDDSRKGVHVSLYVSAVLVGAVKATCIILLPLIVFVFLRPQYREKKHLFAIVCTVFLSVFNYCTWMAFTHSINTGAMFYSYVHPSEQLKWIISNPLIFLWMNVKQFISVASFGIGEFGIFAARTPGRGELLLSTIFLIFAVLYDIFSDEKVITLSSSKKVGFCIALVICFIIGVGAIDTALFLQFNSVASASIEGVQFRYMLPLLPLLFLAIDCLASGMTPKISISHEKRRLEYSLFILSLISWILDYLIIGIEIL